ncbi:hypothetical protein [Halomonas icarae]|uniref:Tetratricopeptide repeat protein n=1 Tax=Halomonas icarae TaxID=2691040 RepID=A0A7X4VZX1_9GAMM|nr:hypothetical protein [Halomonas icarae]MDR5902716.1 hypothetical protein [Halomonas icarae]NAW13272.1 hypothetical protein [Halomonas icarae]
MRHTLLSVSALLLCWLVGVSLAQAAPPLKASFIDDLQQLEAALQEGEAAAVEARALAQARRLAGGNAGDRWARALYLQLAAGAASRQDEPARAAELLAEARGVEGIEAEHHDRWLRDEARLRLAAGDRERGSELLAGWLGRHAGEPRDHWQLVRSLAQLERWEEAAERVQQARKLAPQLDDRQRALAGAVLRRAGRGKAALSLLGAGLTESRDPAHWREAAALAQRLGEAGGAAAIWEAGWRAGVLSGEEDLRRLIELHLAGGTPARAAEHLEAALASDELMDNEANRRLLAQAWERARDRGRALKAWRDVAQRSGKADDWSRLDRLANAWGRDEAAEESLRLLLHPVDLAHKGR